MQTEAYIKIIIQKNEYKILDGWILVIPAIIAFGFKYLFIFSSPLVNAAMFMQLSGRMVLKLNGKVVTLMLRVS